MSAGIDQLREAADAAEKLAAAFAYVGGIGNANEPGSGDKALALAESATELVAEARQIADELEASEDGAA